LGPEGGVDAHSKSANDVRSLIGEPCIFGNIPAHVRGEEVKALVGVVNQASNAGCGYIDSGCLRCEAAAVDYSQIGSIRRRSVSQHRLVECGINADWRSCTRGVGCARNAVGAVG